MKSLKILSVTLLLCMTNYTLGMHRLQTLCKSLASQQMIARSGMAPRVAAAFSSKANSITTHFYTIKAKLTVTNQKDDPDNLADIATNPFKIIEYVAVVNDEPIFREFMKLPITGFGIQTKRMCPNTTNVNLNLDYETSLTPHELAVLKQKQSDGLEQFKNNFNRRPNASIVFTSLTGEFTSK